MGRVKLDSDQLLAAVLVGLGRRPAATAMALRTRDGLGFPINGKTRDSKALWMAGLPTRVGEHGSYQFYGMREAACHEVGGIDIARVQEVFMWEQPLGCEVGMNDRCHLHVCGRGRGRFDVGDEMGALRITGLRQVDFIARPVGLPLRRVAGVHIVGRADEPCMRR
jgi:hypothetical protein